jgi:transposase
LSISSSDIAQVTIGVDMSDQWSNFCALDPAGEVLEEGRVRTNPDAFSKHFGPLDPSRIVMEVGTHSRWASRLLNDLGHEVFVANPWKLKLIAASIKKTDKSDAETLARLGRADPKLLSPIQHRSPEAHADLAVIHAREALTAARALLINHTRGAVKPFGARLPACDADSFERKVRDCLPEELSATLSSVLDVIALMTSELKAADKRIQQLCHGYPETEVLQQIQGVGPLISLTYVLTIGDPTRFKSSRDVGPYLGLVPRQRESGDRSPELRISKAGDRYLRKLLVNGAHYILGYRGPDTDLRRWGLRHSAGSKTAKKKAIVGVARRLAVLLHRLWVTGEVYIPLKTEGMAA